MHFGWPGKGRCSEPGLKAVCFAVLGSNVVKLRQKIVLYTCIYKYIHIYT